MKKFLNDPVHFVDEMLEGIYKAHPAVTYAAGDLRCLVTSRLKAGKVGIATGGGSGHLPTFLGFVGDGMIDGAAVGGVFQSPSAEQMYQVTKHIDQGKGVLYIYGNYTGDIINFDMAAELADLDGIAVIEALRSAGNSVPVILCSAALSPSRVDSTFSSLAIIARPSGPGTPRRATSARTSATSKPRSPPARPAPPMSPP